jgi:hypothetical protein
MEVFEAILDDDPDHVMKVLMRVGDPNVEAFLRRGTVPDILRYGVFQASVAAFFGSIESLRVFVNLGFDPHQRDSGGWSIVHYACCGGVFDILRELDALGVSWVDEESPSRPAELAA